MATHIVQTTIGRNVGTQPLSRKDWVAFITDIADAMRNGGERPEIHYGTGVWDGISEDSAKITVYRDWEPGWELLRTLQRNLGKIAEKYGQDAIALNISQTYLVTR